MSFFSQDIHLAAGDGGNLRPRLWPARHRKGEPEFSVCRYRLGAGVSVLDAVPYRAQWNPPMRQATIHATITNTTPGIITALLARAGDDDPTGAAADADPALNDSHATSSDPFSGLSRLPILRKTRPESV